MAATKELLRKVRRSGLSRDEQCIAVFGANHKQLCEWYTTHWNLNIPQVENNLDTIIVAKKNPYNSISSAKLYAIFPPQRQLIHFRPSGAHEFHVPVETYNIPLGWHAMQIRVDLSMNRIFTFNGMILVAPTTHDSTTLDWVEFPSPNGSCLGDSQPRIAKDLQECIVNNYQAFFASTFNFDDHPGLTHWHKYLLEQSRGEHWSITVKKVQDIMYGDRTGEYEEVRTQHEVYGDLVDEAFRQWETYTPEEMVTLSLESGGARFTNTLVGEQLKNLSRKS